MAAQDSFVRRTVQNSLSGTVAGVAVCLVGHPFDTLKVRLQTQPVHKPVYNGLLDCFFKTLKWEGFGGFYKGVASPLVGQMFFRATMFTTYYQVSTTVTGAERSGQRLQFPEYFFCGAVTGFVSSFVESPIDLFKTKLQIQIIRAKSGGEVKYRNVFHAGAEIIREYGVRGAFQGLPATFQRNIPACGFYFGFYEIVRTYYIEPGKTVADIPFWKVMIAGGSGGFAYWFLTYPTDVIKSAMQSDSSDRGKRQYRSIPHCARTLYVNEGGASRFFRGFAPCLMRSIPANATILMTLELCRNAIAPFT